MKTLTVIIPVYNGEKYLERCIKSILLQEYPGLKLLIIDDGSCDASEEVISKSIKKYNLYFYETRVIRQKNAGVAAARNLGVEIADSDYITFIDQDDWFMKGFIQDFMSYVSKNDIDMVIGGFMRVNDKGKITRKAIPTETEWSKYCFTYPWGRIIRRNFLIENDIRFLKTGIGEDVYFDLVAYSYTKNIITIKNCQYVWFDNPLSVSNEKYTVINQTVNPVYTFDYILRDIKDEKYKKSRYLEYYFIKFTVWYLINNIRRSKREQLAAMKKIMFLWLKENYPGYAENPLISPFRPKGDLVRNRVAVWIYMKLFGI